MTDIHDVNKDTPAVGKNEGGAVTDDAAKAHRRVEREANKAAERGIERQQKDDPGEFSNVGPV
jgi:hypothetical protein